MKKIIAGALALVAMCVLFVSYGKYIEKKTIESAVLIEDTGTEYVISFDGEEHIYTK